MDSMGLTYSVINPCMPSGCALRPWTQALAAGKGKRYICTYLKLAYLRRVLQAVPLAVERGGKEYLANTFRTQATTTSTHM